MADVGSASGFDEGEDFYEDDEPLEKIVAAFEHGEHGVTAPPVCVDTHGLAPERNTGTQPGIVRLSPAPVEPVHPVPVQVPA
jgi:hypothetical protein